MPNAVGSSSEEPEVCEGQPKNKPGKPWAGEATRTDKFLLIAPFTIVGLLLLARPFHPFLLAEHPTLLAALTGSTPSVLAAAAFAKVEQTSLLVPIAAGVFGSVKFSWLFWWAGRRWGRNIIELVAPSEKVKEKLYAVQHKPWYGRLGVLATELPGVPSLLIILFAGWQRMNFLAFMGLISLSSLMWVGFVTWAGYSLGQRVVDVVLVVDEYAVWVSLAIVVWLAFYSGRKKSKRNSASRSQAES